METKMQNLRGIEEWEKIEKWVKIIDMR